ncbi:MAG: hypothetical protein R6V44_00945 [Paracoccaceae bacterium]
MSDGSEPAGGTGTRVHGGGGFPDGPAVLAGAVFAAALSLVMLNFGGAVGLSMASPHTDLTATPAPLAIAAGLWFVSIMLSGFGAGGYVAGRLRRRAAEATATEARARDGVHGLTVWAIVLLPGMALGLAGGGIGAGGARPGEAVEIVTQADIGRHAGLMLRGADIDDAAQSEVLGVIGRAATEGEIPERDRVDLAAIVAERTGLDGAAARARVDATVADAKATRAAALEGVERARTVRVVLGFVFAASLLAGAAVAYLAAGLGGRHRDREMGLDAPPLDR